MLGVALPLQLESKGNLGTRLAVSDACALDPASGGLGSCAPLEEYVCGLNGQNFEEKVYVGNGTDGSSCRPLDEHICGLNGQNYNNKVMYGGSS